MNYAPFPVIHLSAPILRRARVLAKTDAQFFELIPAGENN
jgi:hypothetical protein